MVVIARMGDDFPADMSMKGGVKVCFKACVIKLKPNNILFRLLQFWCSLPWGARRSVNASVT